ncbi:phenylalanine--tRNA ligase subunit alpha, partial [candidate division KSB1 bacterium]|nr:phenylalanine--tRNA ligase subunit alpha [candidate division KSB1 bacterium]
MAESFDTILSELNNLEEAFKNDSKEVKQPQSLEEIRIKYLGRKGSVAQYFKKMGAVSAEDKP